MTKPSRASLALSSLVALSLSCGAAMDDAPSVPLSQAPLQVTAEGLILTPFIHNNPQSDTDAGRPSPQLASGSYAKLPAPTGETNVSGTPEILSAQWLRVGNVVTVSGVIRVTATAGSLPTAVHIPLPVQSYLPKPEQLAGTGYSAPPASIFSYLLAAVVPLPGPVPKDSYQAELRFVSNASGGVVLHIFQFSYQVLP